MVPATSPDSELARLKARLETMPVIEQAKGIVMAREGCGPDEAFDRLRRASQRGQRQSARDGRCPGRAGRHWHGT